MLYTSKWKLARNKINGQDWKVHVFQPSDVIKQMDKAIQSQDQTPH